MQRFFMFCGVKAVAVFGVLAAVASNEGVVQDCEYGIRQIEQMCDDRPDMKGVFPDGHAILRWCAAQFETGEHGRRIIWDYAEPKLSTAAEHWPRLEGYTAAIRISKDQPSSGLDKWCMLVFEFHNIQFRNKRIDLDEALCNYKISVNKFSMESARTEFDAMHKSIAFLKKHGVESMVAAGDIATLVMLSTPNEFEVWLKSFDEGADGRYDPKKYSAEYGRRLLEQTEQQQAFQKESPSGEALK